MQGQPGSRAESEPGRRRRNDESDRVGAEAAPRPYAPALHRAILAPRLLTPSTVLGLQSSVGNQVVMRLLRRDGTGAVAVTPVRRGPSLCSRGAGAAHPAVAQRHTTLTKGEQLEEETEDEQEGGAVQRLVGQVGDPTSFAPIQRLKAPADLGVAETKFRVALTKHKADRTLLERLLEEGKRSRTDRRLANSCEWIATKGVKLFAVTTSGDTDERVEAAGKDKAAERTYFPKGDPSLTGDLKSAVYEYNWRDLDDNANIAIHDHGLTAAVTGKDAITIFNPSALDKETIFETLRHEVQHLADKSKYEAMKAAATTDAQVLEAALEYYKGEYLAYSMDKR